MNRCSKLSTADAMVVDQVSGSTGAHEVGGTVFLFSRGCAGLIRVGGDRHPAHIGRPIGSLRSPLLYRTTGTLRTPPRHHDESYPTDDRGAVPAVRRRAVVPPSAAAGQRFRDLHATSVNRPSHGLHTLHAPGARSWFCRPGAGAEKARCLACYMRPRPVSSSH